MNNRDISQNQYIVATVKPWNIEAFHAHSQKLPGHWHLLSEKTELTLEKLRQINPRFIFFPHWSWIVPTEVLREYDCVCFHMTDVPYGRGGSPLQNLIERGHEDSVLTALRMIEELDAGPVYGKMALDLRGSALEIYQRTGTLCYDLIRYIVEEEPSPVPQEGEIVKFERRTPAQSKLPEDGTLQDLYNHIRMLDAPTYPRTQIEHGEFIIHFSDANLKNKSSLTATVTISQKENDPECK